MAMWIFTRAILEGRPNNGAMKRDFTYIDDIVTGTLAALDTPPGDDGLVKAGDSKAPHALYNIGNHKPEELGHMIDLLEAACGRPAIRDYQPMQPGDVVATFADITAIERDLEFAPRTTIAEGIPRFVTWYRDYHGV
jgi:UDP-glucuronate 4-epimerase